jgi:nitronate monooxygenase
MLSFGDPRPFVDEIRAAGARLICQCQDMGNVMDAARLLDKHSLDSVR